MRSLLIVLSVVGVAIARPGHLGLGLLHSPLAYSSVASPLAYSTFAAPIPYAHTSQYHAQDELGQYSYGYAGGPSAKSEVKTFDGVTRGGYSYVDAEGKVQSVNYVADPLNGFRVAATNLPVAPEPIPADPLVAPEPVQDTPEVAAAKVAHEAAFAEAKAAADAAPDVNIIEGPAPVDVAPAAELLPASVFSRTVVSPVLSHASVNPFSVAPAVTHSHIAAPFSNFAYSAYAPSIAPAHIAYAAPHAISSQYHAQDELGQYSYGYSGGPSAKSEVKTFDGVTRGGYSYIDAEGIVQNVNYVADPINGFRVAATNLPVAPVAPEAPVLEAIPDSPDVAEAKAQHFAAHEEAKARLVA